MFRFLQIVVHDEEAARTVAAHAASRSADNPRAGLGMQVPVYDVVFTSVLHARRMCVPVRVCLSGDERFLLPLDQGAGLSCLPISFSSNLPILAPSLLGPKRGRSGSSKRCDLNEISSVATFAV